MDDGILRLGRMGLVLLRVAIGIGAVGGLVLDVVGSGGLSVRGLTALTSMVAACGMLLSLRHRVAGLALAVAAGLAATAITHRLGLTTSPGFTEMGSLWVLVTVIVRNESPATALTGTLTAFVAVALAATRLGGEGLGGVPSMTILLWFPLALATGLGLWLRYMDSMGAAMSVNARREERLALARELHDTVAHHVTGIVVQAQAAGVVVDSWTREGTSPRPEVVAGSLAAIEASGSETMAAMRRFVGTLRSDHDVPLAPTAGLADLRELVASVSAAGPRVRLSVDDRAVAPDIAPTVFRLVQESLTNVRRHAPRSTWVTVDVGPAEGGLSVQVRNDGPAPPTPTPGRSGYGLDGLAERLLALGGRLHAGPAPGGGWIVSAWIPTS